VKDNSKSLETTRRRHKTQQSGGRFCRAKAPQKLSGIMCTSPATSLLKGRQHICRRQKWISAIATLYTAKEELEGHELNEKWELSSECRTQTTQAVDCVASQ
jgi:hypothetical protein